MWACVKCGAWQYDSDPVCRKCGADYPEELMEEEFRNLQAARAALAEDIQGTVTIAPADVVKFVAIRLQNPTFSPKQFIEIQALIPELSLEAILQYLKELESDSPIHKLLDEAKKMQAALLDLPEKTRTAIKIRTSTLKEYALICTQYPTFSRKEFIEIHSLVPEVSQEAILSYLEAKNRDSTISVESFNESFKKEQFVRNKMLLFNFNVDQLFRVAGGAVLGGAVLGLGLSSYKHQGEWFQDDWWIHALAGSVVGLIFASPKIISTTWALWETLRWRQKE